MKGSDAASAALTARCFQERMKGKSLREIAALLGISHETVRARIQAEIQDTLSFRVDDYRAIQDAEINALATHLWAVVDDPTTNLAARLNATDRLVKLMERRAKLHGLDAPVKVDAVVTQQTQTEAELEALFAEADAENEAIREQINASP